MSSKYTVEFKKSAKKELDKIPKKDKAKIIEAILILQNNPFSEFLKIKKLSSYQNLYRFRVGDYRTIYTVERNALLIHIIKFGHRKEVYDLLD